ncbi:hypothetical protein A3860_23725 [Niastella vici]|uniref:TIR domain-containing protein n=1 Tax=Niastella vici TaxID=1703345 RepID=A0A1V9FYF2_9BACT|nr:toll/interleukin-1 receptor domain-containing protein [Niastella vici]OQP63362.1 hypothetical protein A3860_23725 [Niastella vici]
MTTTYQLITIGISHTLKDTIIESFFQRVEELGIPTELISIINGENFNQYKPNAPSVCLYFGEPQVKQFPDLVILEQLQANAVFTIPIVPDLKNFSNSIPESLRPINGTALNNLTQVDAIVNSILEGLSLLRESRRLFISYRRIESRTMAIQLYEHLDACGFDVFLDTHSIRPGEPFQEELWHRLVDTDVVVLLNTPGFMESRWTAEELAKASAMSIGVVQVIYPEHEPEKMAALCFPFYLDDKHFAGGNSRNPDGFFTVGALKEIAKQVEVVRARSLAARQDNIIREFTSTAQKLNVAVQLHPQKFMTLRNSNGKEVAVIPTVGIPHGFTYNQTAELIKLIRESEAAEALILYDHRNIREKWLNHLIWLDLYLPVKSVKITEIEEWMTKL